MEPIARTIRELYPDAPVDRPLAAPRKPRRLTGPVVVVMFLVTASLVAFAVAGVVMSDGPHWRLVERWLAPVLVVHVVALAAIALPVVLSIEAKRHVVTHAGDGWERWAARRNFVPFGSDPTAVITPKDTGWFLEQVPITGLFGRGVQFGTGELLQGRIAGGAPVIVGTTALSTNLFTFALMQLPRAIEDMLPGSSRVPRRGPWTLHTPGWNELQLESGRLQRQSRIHVDGDPQEPRWRELFDPVAVLGLAKTYRCWWQHEGRWVLVLRPLLHDFEGPFHADEACMTAAFLHERFLLAGRGDVHRAELLPERRRFWLGNF